MRVIAGKARRTNLVTPVGDNTRPTQDRIKETLFNMINNELYDSVFLDLFSGSGGIGIEALSRGARKCYFVEKNNDAIKCIKENIKNTHFEEESKVYQDDVIIALNKIEQLYEDGKKVVMDFIFMDPPYNHEIERDVLEYLSKSSLVDEYTTIIVEASKETKMDYLHDMGYRLEKKKEYKSNYHAFIVRKGR